MDIHINNKLKSLTHSNAHAFTQSKLNFTIKWATSAGKQPLHYTLITCSYTTHTATSHLDASQINKRKTQSHSFKHLLTLTHALPDYDYYVCFSIAWMRYSHLIWKQTLELFVTSSYALFCVTFLSESYLQVGLNKQFWWVTLPRERQKPAEDRARRPPPSRCSAPAEPRPRTRRPPQMQTRSHSFCLLCHAAPSA